MRIKSFLILVYGAAGLCIASITAFMTFLIIEEPIGYKMGSKIVVTVLLTAPVIMLISGLIGGLFARHINTIARRLEKIAGSEYRPDTSKSRIHELQTIHDVSNRLHHEISTLMRSLKERNDELTMMLLTFSHDIKTPLTISNGYIEELEDGMIPNDRVPEIYEKLKLENNFINELCNDILTYQNSKAEKVRANIDIFLKPVADEVITLLNAPVVNEIDPSFSLSFNAVDLKKVLMNLLQNALQYAQAKEIKVYSKNRNIVIEDSGIGIDINYSHKIFEPFFTIDDSKHRENGGFGLGLAITKNLCQRNRCRIEYDPTYQSGARFILSEA
jgi:two-component system sensor histidine kinase SaeS